jgi:hypothetical protein
MAWNTHRLQLAIDGMPGAIAPIGYKHINLRGILTFDLSRLGRSLLGRPSAGRHRKTRINLKKQSFLCSQLRIVLLGA